MRITILAVGQMKDKNLKGSLDTYLTRLTAWPVTCIEIPTGTNTQENQTIIQKLNGLKDSIVFACDKSGTALSTDALYKKIADAGINGTNRAVFIIGGADGLSPEVLQQANTTINFGQFVWPHQLARVMLAEQIYRCQQIDLNHPYHRA